MNRITVIAYIAAIVAMIVFGVFLVHSGYFDNAWYKMIHQDFTTKERLWNGAFGGLLGILFFIVTDFINKHKDK